MDECEDGEIVDFDVEDEVYVPLERPTTLTTHNHIPTPTVDSESEDSSSSSDTDSSSGPSSAKRSKVLRPKKLRPKPKNVRHPSEDSKRNKYNVWSTGLQEEALTNELENCGAMQKYSRDRDVESYDFTLKYTEREEDMKNDDDDDDEPPPGQQLTNKRKHGERGSVKHRLGRRPSPSDGRSQSWPRTLLDLTVTIDDSVERVSKDIANKLSETKDDLINRVVEVVGKEKAISVFKETQRIELNGGMLIMNQSRRRSPGGVFLFLIKGDASLSPETKERIFIEDSKQTRRQIKNKKKAEHRQHVEKLRKALDGELPVLMSRAELVIQESLNSEGAVSNPPPSPATDTRGDSSNDSVPLASPVCYDDDCLDVYADTMEQF